MTFDWQAAICTASIIVAFAAGFMVVAAAIGAMTGFAEGRTRAGIAWGATALAFTALTVTAAAIAAGTA